MTIYEDEGTTSVSSATYFSDGEAWRYWDGSQFTTEGDCGIYGSTPNCPTITVYHGPDATAVCCDDKPTVDWYFDSANISTATTLYGTDSTCTTPYPFSRYITTDKVNYYYWNSTTQNLSGPTACPTCDEGGEIP